MSRIKNLFAALKAQNKKALIPFITAGDPHPNLCVPMMHALANNGADIIELGVPFSDPMADGPVIQRASERALKHHVSLKQVLSFVAEFRKTNATTPVVLMGYANPIEAMGAQNFAAAAHTADVDGVLVVDYPPEEAAAFCVTLKPFAIDPIFLLSPTSSAERIDKTVALASGYLYYVSLKGVTGAANIDAADVAKMLSTIRAKTDLPVGVGFGIRDGATAATIASVADAVVIGSRLIVEIENQAENTSAEKTCEKLASLIAMFRAAIDNRNALQAA
jgi:tryptophan synthase alpha chain